MYVCVHSYIYSFCSCRALGGTFTPLSPANITNNSDEKNYKLKTPNLQAALRLVCCVYLLRPAPTSTQGLPDLTSPPGRAGPAGAAAAGREESRSAVTMFFSSV